MTMPGQQTDTAGVSDGADGAADTAPADMSAAAVQAVDAAVSQREQEGRKVGMGVSLSNDTLQ